MSAGWRSILAGVLGRFSAAGSAPPSATNGILIFDTVDNPVFYGTGLIATKFDATDNETVYDTKDVKVRYGTIVNPVIYD